MWGSKYFMISALYNISKLRALNGKQQHGGRGNYFDSLTISDK